MEQPIPHERRGTEFLANERTFLAWIRTSIAVVSLGFLVARFSLWLRELSREMGRAPLRAQGASLPMGEAMMALGGVLAVLAAWRYHVVNRAIEQNRVKADLWLIVLVTALVAVLAVAMAVAAFLAAGGT